MFKKLVFLLTISAAFFLYSSEAKAQCVCNCNDPVPTITTRSDISECMAYCSGITGAGTPTCPPITGTGQAQGGSDPTQLPNPLGSVGTPQVFIGKIIKAALGVVGSLALVMFIYGGFTWMLSGGSPEKVKKGKDILIWATFGLVVIFMSYALVQFVIEGIKS